MKSDMIKDDAYLADIYEKVKQQSYVLLIINLKKFRNFKILYGYAKSQEILEHIYRLLDTALHDDEYFAHSYADNFTLLLPYISDMDLFERLLELDLLIYRVPDPIVYEKLFLSMGLVKLSDIHASYGDAWELANIARIQCREYTFRNTSYEYFEEHLLIQAKQSAFLEQETQAALYHHEYQVYIQPKVNPRTNKILGGEALLRWIRPNKEEIPLSEFLSIVNQNCFIRNIDLYVFETVCQYLHDALRRKEPVVPISFNLSKSYFYDDVFLTEYMEVFEKYDIPKELITFELLENITMDDSGRIHDVVDEIHKAGFLCAVDDFGKGYSSLDVIVNVPVDIIKLDRSIFTTCQKQQTFYYLDMLLKLLQPLHTTLVAEGIESKEIADYIKDKVDIIQGFYYYRPMPIKAFQQLLLHQQKTVE